MLALFLPFAHLAAKEKEPVITPSFANPLKAVVFTGGEVVIPLRANAPTSGTKYLLRSLPKNGTLGEIMTTEDGLASVAYRHNAGDPAGTDSFFYAVQTPGAAVSSRAMVSILVINRPPKVEGPAAVDFGRIPVGGSAREVIQFRNSGGEPFQARLAFPSPWECHLVRIEIPGGGSVDLPVDFLPDGAENFSGSLFLEGAGGTTVRFTGTGYVVFDVAPSLLKLRDLPDGGRSEKLTVTNRTGENVEIGFECPPEIRPISPRTIEAGGQAVVTVEADATLVSGGRKSLVVREKRTSKSVEVVIPSLPARLSIVPAAALDFGEIQAGKPASREIKITNSGGLPAALEISVPDWILSDVSHLLLKPGEERGIRIEVAATRPGRLRDRMLFKYNNSVLEFLVSATVPSVAPHASPSASPEQKPERPVFNPAETKRQALCVTEISQKNGSVILRWQDPNPDPRTYRLEALQITSEASLARQAALEPDPGSEKFSADEFAANRLKLTRLFEQASKNDKVVKTWEPLQKLDLHDCGNSTFEAAFPAPPGQQTIRVRITPILADGSTSPVATEIRIPIKLSPPRRWPVKTILISLAVLLAAAVLIRKFKR